MTLMKNTEKVKAALDRIERGLVTINTDEDWLAFLRFQSSFYHYSFGNAMLIFLEFPHFFQYFEKKIGKPLDFVV